MKKIYRDQRFRNHPKKRKKALRADKKLWTIARGLVRELKRNLGEQSVYTELIERFEAILSQRRHSRQKIYSTHELEVQCISKGKERKKHKLFCKRAGIGPTIGHLKSDHCLGRNFYNGLVEDAVNILLTAAAYNFKRAMRALLDLIKIINEMLWNNDIALVRAF